MIMIPTILVKKKKIIKLIVIYSLLVTFSQISNYNSSIQALILDDYIDISVSEAYNMTENTSSLVILDVRTEREYSGGHIKNSYSLPYTQIESRQNELPGNKSQPILVYCKSGMRSAIASASLVSLNFTAVYNMLGGFSAWVSANYPYEGSMVDPTQDLITLFLVITIISTIGLVVILFVGFVIWKRKQKNKDLIN
ncbi:MAG: rhodanese-like domain-containing protein [Candidatus Heimdallarchaeota archaeon]|nr:rhodanese-like domain-containing protein [Candidatus Heimdallarchaeota archaeon]